MSWQSRLWPKTHHGRPLFTMHKGSYREFVQMLFNNNEAVPDLLTVDVRTNFFTLMRTPETVPSHHPDSRLQRRLRGRQDRLQSAAQGLSSTAETATGLPRARQGRTRRCGQGL